MVDHDGIQEFAGLLRVVFQAVKRIGQLAQKTADGAYVQHIIKRVELHGEKGL